MTNKLYYGDNLHVLREYVGAESVDLIYLDPPFNSDATYNVLFKTPQGKRATAQVKAFEDTWKWGHDAELAFDDVLHAGGPTAAMLRALRGFMGESDTMAYLAMMAVRLTEMRRVLKPSGSLYLHCDPTASHYLKVMLDGIFGAGRFLNEVTWKRTHSHGNVGRNFGSVTDTILVYTRSADFTWNQLHVPFAPDYIEQKFRYTDPDGRRWQSVTLRNPSVRPNLRFPFTASNGMTYEPHPNGWACDIDRLRRYDQEGRLHFPAKHGGQLRLKMYLDESPGVRLQNLWDDIPALNSQAQERLGYPTQKPLALLRRIIEASSNPGQVILDPFCGCGTAVHAAQELGRQWIGIDVTHVAVQIIEDRIRTQFPTAARPEVIGRPATIEDARALAERDKYQFQWWAVAQIGGHPRGGHKKGADRGVDGELYLKAGAKEDLHAVISVKAGKHVGPAMVRELSGTRQRERADLGVFICLEEPSPEMRATAAAEGFVETAHGRFPKLQILTASDVIARRGIVPLPAYSTAEAAQAGRAEEKRRGRTPKRPDPTQREFKYEISGGLAAQPKPSKDRPKQAIGSEPTVGRAKRAG